MPFFVPPALRRLLDIYWVLDKYLLISVLRSLSSLTVCGSKECQDHLI